MRKIALPSRKFISNRENVNLDFPFQLSSAQRSERGQVFNKQATTEGTYVTYMPKEGAIQKGRLV